MKTIFAQAATFALSAAGALAIIVGVIHQPQLALRAPAHPVVPPGEGDVHSPVSGPSHAPPVGPRTSSPAPTSPAAPPDTPAARREAVLRLPRWPARWPDRLWCRGPSPPCPAPAPA